MLPVGFTKSYRAKWSHPIFRDLLEAGIWSWMIDSACWDDIQINKNGFIINLKRGQFITSISFMVKGFGISEKRARGLLKNLEKGRMIVTKGASVGTIITICNYSKYQDKDYTEGERRASEGANARQTKGDNKKEVKEDKERKNTTVQKTFFENDIIDNDFEIFWKLYPKTRAGSKKKASASYLKALKENKATTEEIKNGVEKYRNSDEATKNGGQFAKGCAAWLNDDRWKNDYSATQSQNDKHNNQETSYLDKVEAAGKIALRQFEIDDQVDNDPSLPWNRKDPGDNQ